MLHKMPVLSRQPAVDTTVGIPVGSSQLIVGTPVGSFQLALGTPVGSSQLAVGTPVGRTQLPVGTLKPAVAGKQLLDLLNTAD